MMRFKQGSGALMKDTNTFVGRSLNNMANVRKTVRRGCRKGYKAMCWSMVAAASFMWVIPVQLIAGPKGAHVVSGSATIQQQGSNTYIEASNRAIINWQSHDIGVGESVHYQLPTSNARVLSRVMNGDPTRIDGTMTSNGRVYLVNNAGIFFGHQAVVNTSQIYAAAANMSNADFLNGVNRFTDAQGSVFNEGSISAHAVALVGKHVANMGTIVAPNGMVALVAGENVILTEEGGSIQVHLSGSGSSTGDDQPGVENAGSIDAGKGSVTLAASDIYGLAVQTKGDIRAQQIVVSSPGRVAVEGGKLDASENSATGFGGSVQILGNEVALYGNVSIDVSGTLGGGTINIGGAYQGGSSLQASNYTYVGSDVNLTADSTTGDGGQVVVWSDGLTLYYGQISSKSNTGNGGLVEVSGLDTLVFQGSADLTSNSGQSGTLLLDPRIITVVADSDPRVNKYDLIGDPDDLDPNTYSQQEDFNVTLKVPTPPPFSITETVFGNSYLAVSSITNLLNAGNSVNLQARDVITVATPIVYNSAGTLTMEQSAFTDFTIPMFSPEINNAGPLFVDVGIFVQENITNNGYGDIILRSNNEVDTVGPASRVTTKGSITLEQQYIGAPLDPVLFPSGRHTMRIIARNPTAFRAGVDAATGAVVNPDAELHLGNINSDISVQIGGVIGGGGDVLSTPVALDADPSGVATFNSVTNAEVDRIDAPIGFGVNNDFTATPDAGSGSATSLNVLYGYTGSDIYSGVPIVVESGGRWVELRKGLVTNPTVTGIVNAVPDANITIRAENLIIDNELTRDLAIRPTFNNATVTQPTPLGNYENGSAAPAAANVPGGSFAVPLYADPRTDPGTEDSLDASPIDDRRGLYDNATGRIDSGGAIVLESRPGIGITVGRNEGFRVVSSIPVFSLNEREIDGIGVATAFTDALHPATEIFSMRSATHDLTIGSADGGTVEILDTRYLDPLTNLTIKSGNSIVMRENLGGLAGSTFPSYPNGNGNHPTSNVPFVVADNQINLTGSVSLLAGVGRIGDPGNPVQVNSTTDLTLSASTFMNVAAGTIAAPTLTNLDVTLDPTIAPGAAYTLTGMNSPGGPLGFTVFQNGLTGIRVNSIVAPGTAVRIAADAFNSTNEPNVRLDDNAINTTNAPVTVKAAGAIIDNVAGALAPNITGSDLTLIASNGIGDTDAIDTSVTGLDFQNLNDGDVRIDNVVGDLLTIDNFSTEIDALSDTRRGNLDANGDAVDNMSNETVITNGSPITISTDMLFTGDTSISALGSAATTDDLILDASTLTLDGQNVANLTMTLNAGDSIVFDRGSIVTENPFDATGHTVNLNADTEAGADGTRGGISQTDYTTAVIAANLNMVGPADIGSLAFPLQFNATNLNSNSAANGLTGEQFLREVDGLSSTTITAGAGGGDVILSSNGPVSQIGTDAITANFLVLVGTAAGDFDLSAGGANNDVDTIAATVDGNLLFTDADDLTVGNYAVAFNAGGIITVYGFESGDFTNWTTIGSTSVVDSSFGVTPTEGTYQARISNEPDGTAVSDAALETFFGLPAGTFDAGASNDATQGSGILLTLPANTLRVDLDMNFLTDENTPDGMYNDFLVVVPDGMVFGEADTFSTFTSSSSSLNEETGYFSDGGGTNTSIGIAVLHDGDFDVESVALIDNVRVQTSNPFVGVDGITATGAVTLTTGAAGGGVYGAGNLGVNSNISAVGVTLQQATPTAADDSILFVSDGVTIDSHAGPLEFTYDGMALGGLSIIQGTSTALFQPNEATDGITLGGGVAAQDTLQLTDPEIATLQEGFTSLTFGRADGAHTIVVDTASFLDNVTIQAPVSGGSITVSDSGDASLLNNPASIPGITTRNSSDPASVELIASAVPAMAVISINDDIVTQNADITLTATNPLGALIGEGYIEFGPQGMGLDGTTLISAVVNPGDGAKVTIDGWFTGVTDDSTLETLAIRAGTGTITANGPINVLPINPPLNLAAPAPIVVPDFRGATTQIPTGFLGGNPIFEGDDIVFPNEAGLTDGVIPVRTGIMGPDVNVIIRPQNPELNISVENDDFGGLTITQTDINDFTNNSNGGMPYGFSSITLGSEIGTGILSINDIDGPAFTGGGVDAPVVFSEPWFFRMNDVGGDIRVIDHGTAGTPVISNTTDATDFATNIIGGGLIRDIGDDAVLDNDRALTASLTFSASPNTTQIGGRIDTDGTPIEFLTNVEMTSATQLITTGSTVGLGAEMAPNGADISFQNRLDGTNIGTENLTLVAGDLGDILFAGEVGGRTKVGNILVANDDPTADGDNTLEPAESFTAQQDVIAASFTLEGDPSQTDPLIDGPVLFAGDLITRGNLDTAGGVVSIASADAITVLGTINATGGGATAGMPGTAGGAVTLDSLTALSVATINTSGGQANANAGGNAGLINLNTNASDVATQVGLNGDLLAIGGLGATPGTNDGLGANITIGDGDESILIGNLGPVDILVDTGSNNTAANPGNVLFDGTLNGQANSLTVRAGRNAAEALVAGINDVTFTGAITNINTLTVLDSFNTTFGAGVATIGGGVNVTASNSSFLNGDILAQSGGSIIFNGDVELDASLAIDSDNNDGGTDTDSIDNGDIIINGNLNVDATDSYTLRLDAGFGNILIDGEVGGDGAGMASAANRLDSITINDANDVTFGSLLNIGNDGATLSLLQQSGDGTTTFVGPVTTTGDVTFGVSGLAGVAVNDVHALSTVTVGDGSGDDLTFNKSRNATFDSTLTVLGSLVIANSANDYFNDFTVEGDADIGGNLDGPNPNHNAGDLLIANNAASVGGNVRFGGDLRVHDETQIARSGAIGDFTVVGDTLLGDVPGGGGSDDDLLIADVGGTTGNLFFGGDLTVADQITISDGAGATVGNITIGGTALAGNLTSTGPIQIARNGGIADNITVYGDLSTTAGLRIANNDDGAGNVSRVLDIDVYGDTIVGNGTGGVIPKGLTLATFGGTARNVNLRGAVTVDDDALFATGVDGGTGTLFSSIENLNIGGAVSIGDDGTGSLVIAGSGGSILDVTLDSTLEVADNTFIADDAGSSIQSFWVDGSAMLGTGTAMSGNLQIASNATAVGGDFYFGNDLSVTNNTFVADQGTAGNFTVLGNATFGTAGQNDDANFAMSNLAAGTGGTLGDLYFGGNVLVADDLRIADDGATVGNITVLGDVTTGATTGGADVTIATDGSSVGGIRINGNLSVGDDLVIAAIDPDFTDPVAGTNGGSVLDVTIGGDVSVGNGGLAFGSGRMLVGEAGGTAGNIRIDGTLDVDGDTTFATGGGSSVASLTVGGAANIGPSADLGFTSNLDIAVSGASVGNVTFNNSLTVDDDLTIAANGGQTLDVNVVGDTTVGLDGSGDLRIAYQGGDTQDVHLAGGLEVNGDASIARRGGTTHDVAIDGYTNITGDLRLGVSNGSTNDIRFGDDLDVTGFMEAAFAGGMIQNLTVDGDTRVGLGGGGQTLTIADRADSSAGNILFGGNVTTDSDVNVGTNGSSFGDLTVVGKLNVGGLVGSTGGNLNILTADGTGGNISFGSLMVYDSATIGLTDATGATFGNLDILGDAMVGFGVTDGVGDLTISDGAGTSGLYVTIGGDLAVDGNLSAAINGGTLAGFTVVGGTTVGGDVTYGMAGDLRFGSLDVEGSATFDGIYDLRVDTTTNIGDDLNLVNTINVDLFGPVEVGDVGMSGNLIIAAGGGNVHDVTLGDTLIVSDNAIIGDAAGDYVNSFTVTGDATIGLNTFSDLRIAADGGQVGDVLFNGSLIVSDDVYVADDGGIVGDFTIGNDATSGDLTAAGNFFIGTDGGQVDNILINGNLNVGDDLRVAALDSAFPVGDDGPTAGGGNVLDFTVRGDVNTGTFTGLFTGPGDLFIGFGGGSARNVLIEGNLDVDGTASIADDAGSSVQDVTVLGDAMIGTAGGFEDLRIAADGGTAGNILFNRNLTVADDTYIADDGGVIGNFTVGNTATSGSAALAGNFFIGTDGGQANNVLINGTLNVGDDLRIAALDSAFPVGDDAVGTVGGNVLDVTVRGDVNVGTATGLGTQPGDLIIAQAAGTARNVTIEGALDVDGNATLGTGADSSIISFSTTGGTMIGTGGTGDLTIAGAGAVVGDVSFAALDVDNNTFIANDADSVIHDFTVTGIALFGSDPTTVGTDGNLQIANDAMASGHNFLFENTLTVANDTDIAASGTVNNISVEGNALFGIAPNGGTIDVAVGPNPGEGGSTGDIFFGGTFTSDSDARFAVNGGTIGNMRTDGAALIGFTGSDLVIAQGAGSMAGNVVYNSTLDVDDNLIVADAGGQVASFTVEGAATIGIMGPGGSASFATGNDGVAAPNTGFSSVGDIRFGDTLDVAINLTFADNTGIVQNVNVDGAATVGNDLIVAGNGARANDVSFNFVDPDFVDGTMAGDVYGLNVGHDALLANDANSQLHNFTSLGDTTIGSGGAGNLNVANNITSTGGNFFFGSTLTVEDDTNIANAGDILDFTVIGNATLGDDFSNDLLVASTMTGSTRDIFFGGTLDVGDNATLAYSGGVIRNLTVDGVTNIGTGAGSPTGDLVIAVEDTAGDLNGARANDIHFGDDLNVRRDATFADNTGVINNITIDGNTDIGRAMRVSTVGSTVTGDVHLGGTLDTVTTLSFADINSTINNVTVDGAINVGTSLQIADNGLNVLAPNPTVVSSVNNVLFGDDLNVGTFAIIAVTNGTVNNMTVDGAVDIGTTLQISQNNSSVHDVHFGDTLNTGGFTNISVDNSSINDFTVDGDATIGDVAGGNLTIAGLASSAHDVAFNGNLDVDNDTFIADDTNSSIGNFSVRGDALFGSDTSGDLRIVSAANATGDDFYFGTDVTVTNNTYVADQGTIGDFTVIGDATFGTAGQHDDASFAAAELAVGTGGTIGDILIGGNLLVADDLRFSDDGGSIGDITVGGNATIGPVTGGGDLSFATDGASVGNVLIVGNLDVSDDLYISTDDLSSDGDDTMAGGGSTLNVTVRGDVTVGSNSFGPGNLVISQAGGTTRNVLIEGELDVDGSATLGINAGSSILDVTVVGPAAIGTGFGGNLVVADDDATVGNVLFNSTLDVDQNATFATNGGDTLNIEVVGATDIGTSGSGTLTIANAATSSTQNIAFGSINIRGTAGNGAPDATIATNGGDVDDIFVDGNFIVGVAGGGTNGNLVIGDGAGSTVDDIQINGSLETEDNLTVATAGAEVRSLTVLGPVEIGYFAGSPVGSGDMILGQGDGTDLGDVHFGDRLNVAAEAIIGDAGAIVANVRVDGPARIGVPGGATNGSMTIGSGAGTMVGDVTFNNLVSTEDELTVAVAGAQVLSFTALGPVEVGYVNGSIVGAGSLTFGDGADSVLGDVHLGDRLLVASNASIGTDTAMVENVRVDGNTTIGTDGVDRDLTIAGTGATVADVEFRGFLNVDQDVFVADDANSTVGDFTVRGATNVGTGGTGSLNIASAGSAVGDNFLFESTLTVEDDTNVATAGTILNFTVLGAANLGNADGDNLSMASNGGSIDDILFGNVLNVGDDATIANAGGVARSLTVDGAAYIGTAGADGTLLVATNGGSTNDVLFRSTLTTDGSATFGTLRDLTVGGATIIGVDDPADASDPSAGDLLIINARDVTFQSTLDVYNDMTITSARDVRIQGALTVGVNDDANDGNLLFSSINSLFIGDDTTVANNATFDQTTLDIFIDGNLMVGTDFNGGPGDLTINNVRDVTVLGNVDVEGDALIGEAVNVYVDGDTTATTFTENHGLGNTFFDGDVIVDEGIVANTAFSVSIEGLLTVDGLLRSAWTDFNKGVANDFAGGSDIFIEAGDVEFLGGDSSVSIDEATDAANFGASGTSVTTDDVGIITIQPFEIGSDIGIGNAGDGSPMHLSNADIAALSNGFDLIRIGRADGAGTMIIGNNVTFRDETHFRMPTLANSPTGTTGSIITLGNITGNDPVAVGQTNGANPDDARLVFDAPLLTSRGGTIGTDENDIVFQSGGSRLAVFNRTDANDSEALRRAALGDQAMDVDGLMNVLIEEATTVTTSVFVEAGGRMTGGDIVFENNINGGDDVLDNLKLYSGRAANIEVGATDNGVAAPVTGYIGNEVPLGNLTILQTNNATFGPAPAGMDMNADVTVTSFTQVDGQGTTAFNGRLTAIGDAAVIDPNDREFRGGKIEIVDGNNVLFEGTVTGSTFIQRTGSGNTSFDLSSGLDTVDGVLTSLRTGGFSNVNGGRVEIDDVAGTVFVAGGINTSGGTQTTPGAGFNGGSVEITGGTIDVARIITSGTDAFLSPGPLSNFTVADGGDAAPIKLNATAGSQDIVLRGDLIARGGAAEAEYTPGSAADILLGDASNDDILLLPDANYIVTPNTITLSGNDITFEGEVDTYNGENATVLTGALGVTTGSATIHPSPASNARLTVNTYNSYEQNFGTSHIFGVTSFNGDVGTSRPLMALTTDFDETTMTNVNNGYTLFNGNVNNTDVNPGQTDVILNGSSADFYDPVVIDLQDLFIQENGNGNVTFHNTVNSVSGSMMMMDGTTMEIEGLYGLTVNTTNGNTAGTEGLTWFQGEVGGHNGPGSGSAPAGHDLDAASGTPNVVDDRIETGALGFVLINVPDAAEDDGNSVTKVSGKLVRTSDDAGRGGTQTYNDIVQLADMNDPSLTIFMVDNTKGGTLGAISFNDLLTVMPGSPVQNLEVDAVDISVKAVKVDGNQTYRFSNKMVLMDDLLSDGGTITFDGKATEANPNGTGQLILMENELPMSLPNDGDIVIDTNSNVFTMDPNANAGPAGDIVFTAVRVSSDPGNLSPNVGIGAIGQQRLVLDTQSSDDQAGDVSLWEFNNGTDPMTASMGGQYVNALLIRNGGSTNAFDGTTIFHNNVQLDDNLSDIASNLSIIGDGNIIVAAPDTFDFDNQVGDAVQFNDYSMANFTVTIDTEANGDNNGGAVDFNQSSLSANAEGPDAQRNLVIDTSTQTGTGGNVEFGDVGAAGGDVTFNEVENNLNGDFHINDFTVNVTNTTMGIGGTHGTILIRDGAHDANVVNTITVDDDIVFNGPVALEVDSTITSNGKDDQVGNITFGTNEGSTINTSTTSAGGLRRQLIVNSANDGTTDFWGEVGGIAGRELRNLTTNADGLTIFHQDVTVVGDAANSDTAANGRIQLNDAVELHPVTAQGNLITFTNQTNLQTTNGGVYFYGTLNSGDAFNNVDVNFRMANLAGTGQGGDLVFDDNVGDSNATDGRLGNVDVRGLPSGMTFTGAPRDVIANGNFFATSFFQDTVLSRNTSFFEDLDTRHHTQSMDSGDIRILAGNNITITDINTSGTTFGANAGDVALLPGGNMGTVVAGLPFGNVGTAGTDVSGILILGTESNDGITALGGGGAGTDGNIQLGPDGGWDSVPLVSTIQNTVVGSSFTIDAGGVNMVENSKATFYNDFTIVASGNVDGGDFLSGQVTPAIAHDPVTAGNAGNVILSDVSVFNDFTVSVADGSDIVIRTRPKALVANFDGTVVLDRGVDFVAGRFIDFSETPGLYEPRGGRKPIFASPGADHDPSGYGGVLSPYVNVDYGPLTMANLSMQVFGSAAPFGTTLDLSSRGADGTGAFDGGSTANLAEAFAHATVVNEHEKVVPMVNAFGSQLELLPELGVESRDPDPIEQEWMSLAQRFWNDLDNDVADDLRIVAVNRLPYDRVESVLKAYRDVFYTVGEDADTGEPALIARKGEVRSALQSAFDAYKAKGDFMADGFVDECMSGQHPEAGEAISGLATLLDRLHATPLTDYELMACKNRIYGSILPNGMTIEQLDSAVEFLRSSRDLSASDDAGQTIDQPAEDQPAAPAAENAAPAEGDAAPAK
ncbi:MAG: filamentous hemagglutinin N-terminal domain-containing protein [Phycisphaera sp.]|nr:filamentous hemagglutinin N-terminal domain-containing protein [Phycisphaera sp.]